MGSKLTVLRQIPRKVIILLSDQPSVTELSTLRMEAVPEPVALAPAPIPASKPMPPPLRTYYQSPDKAAFAPPNFNPIEEVKMVALDELPAENLDLPTGEKKSKMSKSARIAMRTERHFRRHFDFGNTLEQARLQILGIFRNKKKRKCRANGGTRCFDKLKCWRRTELAEPYIEDAPLKPAPVLELVLAPVPEPVPEPEPVQVSEPVPSIVVPPGLTLEQTIHMNKVMDDVTQKLPGNVDFTAGSEIQPFIMVHQTNEFEIMTTIGSFRLNPHLVAKRDVDSINYASMNMAIRELALECSQHEFNRRRIAFNREHTCITLTESYEIGHGINPTQFGVPEYVAQMPSNKTIASMTKYPVVHARDPVLGVPFKLYFKDVVDIPEYPVEVLRAINTFLAPCCIEIIDLRCRTEEMIGAIPFVLDQKKVCKEVSDSIYRSAGALYAIRHTARYFVVYAFYSGQVPFRYYQSVVRFTPYPGGVETDWVNDGVTRFEIEEPDPHPIMSYGKYKMQ